MRPPPKRGSKLEALIRAFENQNQPYSSLVLSMWTNRYGDYDDLARDQGMVRGRRHGAGGMVKAPRTIPDAVRDTQARASDPTASAFVSANAGSGKTHVLVQRVIRLLLAGVPPEKILCITFTKAAAANMAERVFTTLGHWVTLDDNALDAAIRDVGIAHPDRSCAARARKLFACALETPGGLKVQTIHALCTRLLQQFPFEANVPARFAVLDDRDQTEMMERANLKVLLEAARDPDSATGRALLTAMASAADVTFKEVVREACLAAIISWPGPRGRQRRGRRAQMAAALGVDAERPHRGRRDARLSMARSCRDRAGTTSPSRWRTAASPTTTRPAGFARQRRFPARHRSMPISASSSPTKNSPRKAVLTKNFGEQNPSVARLFENEATASAD